MLGSWEIGILTLLYKHGSQKLLRNFRPVTLLNSIYKIRAGIMTNRSTPFTNLLTSETQFACKKHINHGCHLLHQKKSN